MLKSSKRIIKMIRRPSYREFLNQTINTPNGQTCPQPISGFGRPPLPAYKAKYSPLPSQTESPNSKLAHTLSQFPSHFSSLRQSQDYSTYSSTKKQNTESSFTVSSNNKLEVEPAKKAKPSKWRSSWQAPSPTYFKELTQNYLENKENKNGQTYENSHSSTFLAHSKSKESIRPPLDTQLERKRDTSSNRIQKLQKTVKGMPSKKDNCTSTTVLPTFIRNKSRSKTPIKVTSPTSQVSMTALQFNKKKSGGLQDKCQYYSHDKEISKTPRKSIKSSVFCQKKQSKMSVSDFLMGKKLGEGRFGNVFMVIHKYTGAIFALKCIPKATLKQHMMIDQFALEVRLQAGIYHSNLVSVYAVFDDQQSVYLLLEYLSGGSLYGELKKRNTLPEQLASQRIKALCQAVEALHLRGVAHRDIKPENIILCNGVCKLGDFGWATLCDERRRTYCGTTDYVSPEIVQGKEYGPGVDMWCVGILAFELLTGRPPFYHLSRQETFRRIGEATPTFPNTLSKEAVDFISGLLQKVPEERMSATDALQHPFITKYES